MKTVVYKKTEDAEGTPVELKMYIFEPDGHTKNDQRACIVFFFGGGWRFGSPHQFFPHSEYLADRGMVAMAAEYRVKDRNGTTPFESVKDAKSAVRYIRAHAAELGVDPDRIAAGGGSAGGHLAACTGVVTGQDEPDEDISISSAANAMALFNPALVFEGARLVERMGERWKEISPHRFVRPGLPSAIIFHGENDTVVPIETARVFTEAMVKAGNRCELVEYAGEGHGFFNKNRDTEYYMDTLKKADAFLVSLGFLEFLE